MAAPRPIISCRDLTRIYRMGDQEVRALDGVNLDIHEGEFVAIMGPSGSGKSSLMNLIGALDRPTSGEMWINGRALSEMNRDELADLRNETLGFVFQQFNLLPRMTAIEQVELPLVYQSVHRRRRMAKEALARVGLGARMNHRPTELSGGQQQRVAIARALVVNPRVVLADEPTGALDTATGEEVMAIFGELVDQGISVILVTHEPEIAAYAHRVIRMRDGHVVEDATRTLVPA